MSSEYEEELEALQSVYSDLILRTIHSKEHSEFKSLDKSEANASTVPSSSSTTFSVLSKTKTKTKTGTISTKQTILPTPTHVTSHESQDKTQIHQNQNDQNDSQLQAIINLSCTPRSSSTSFVFTEIEISIPLNYPHTQSKVLFKIIKSSGLRDEGKEIKESAMEFILESTEGECILFQLICIVYDYLDNCNIGECSICEEELEEFDCTGECMCCSF